MWRSILPLLNAMADDPARFDGVTSLGVDEHIWHHVDERRRGPKALTGMVDLTRDQAGHTRARLLDSFPADPGKAYADWLDARGDTFRQRVQVATLDPFHGYKNAIDDQLADATSVLYAFHVVKLGGQAVDGVRRRVQQTIHGHRGRKDDPLYRIRNLLRCAEERLTERQQPGSPRQHDEIARPRGLLTTRACWWAIGQLHGEHASVLGLARQHRIRLTGVSPPAPTAGMKSRLTGEPAGAAVTHRRRQVGDRPALRCRPGLPSAPLRPPRRHRRRCLRRVCSQDGYGGRTATRRRGIPEESRGGPRPVILCRRRRQRRKSFTAHAAGWTSGKAALLVLAPDRDAVRSLVTVLHDAASGPGPPAPASHSLPPPVTPTHRAWCRQLLSPGYGLR